MRFLNLFRTTAFRLALIYLLLFAASAFALIAFIYWSTAGFMASQTDETINAEIQGLREQYGTSGLPGLRQVVIERSSVARGGLYLLANADLSRIAGNLDRWPDSPTGQGGWVDFTYDRAILGGSDRRAARARHLELLGGFQLLVGRDVHERREIEDRIESALFWSAVITVGLGLVGGLLMSRNVTRRLDVINETTRDIIEGDLQRRVPLSGSKDEFDELATNLNDMLDQIGSLMAGMSEVADNIAHDLRTPLNRLRSRLEVTLMKPASEQEYREALEGAIAESDQLISTFNSLLLIARAETGEARENFEDLDLKALLTDVVELYEPLAEAKRITLKAQAPQPAHINGDHGLISQVFANLIDNAIKYTPEDGSVTVSVKRTGRHAVVEVRDTGAGIPAAERDHVLRRFVRLEASRNEPGSGLGLSLVAAVARLHDAEITLGDAKPGLIATLRFNLKD